MFTVQLNFFTIIRKIVNLTMRVTIEPTDLLVTKKMLISMFVKKVINNYDF
jgi:hypothetical protein